MKRHWRALVGGALLVGQIAWVLAGLRPRVWAPFHEHAVYQLAVERDGHRLSTRESLERYQLSTWHFNAERDENWETNSLEFVKDVIRRQEANGAGPLTVELKATVNGRVVPDWMLSR